MLASAATSRKNSEVTRNHKEVQVLVLRTMWHWLPQLMPTNIHSKDIPKLHVTTYDYHQLSQFILTIEQDQWNSMEELFFIYVIMVITSPFSNRRYKWNTFPIFNGKAHRKSYYLPVRMWSYICILLMYSFQHTASTCVTMGNICTDTRGDTNTPAVMNCLTT